MPMVVGPPSWQDQLRDEMHELETRARLDDPLALGQAFRIARLRELAKVKAGADRADFALSTSRAGI